VGLQRSSGNTSLRSQQSRLFREANLEISGRRSTVDCLELTEIDLPLLGVTPLEILGFEPDLRHQCLRRLPMTGQETYLYA
jgi:predicted aspartyl protease